MSHIWLSSGPLSSSPSSPKCTCFIVFNHNNKAMHGYCFRWTAVFERWLDDLAVSETILLNKLISPVLSKRPWAQHSLAFSMFALWMTASFRWLQCTYERKWIRGGIFSRGGRMICSPVNYINCALKWTLECTRLSFVYARICQQRCLLDGNAKQQRNTNKTWTQTEELSN